MPRRGRRTRFMTRYKLLTTRKHEERDRPTEKEVFTCNANRRAPGHKDGERPHSNTKGVGGRTTQKERAPQLERWCRKNRGESREDERENKNERVKKEGR